MEETKAYKDRWGNLYLTKDEAIKANYRRELSHMTDNPLVGHRIINDYERYLNLLTQLDNELKGIPKKKWWKI